MMETVDNIILSDEQTKRITKIIVENVCNMIPKMVQDMRPVIEREIQRTLNYTYAQIAGQVRSVPTNSVAGQSQNGPINHTAEQIRTLADQYTHQYPNKTKFNECHQKRDDFYYKQIRNEKLIELYEEGLRENPVYVPRKFRKDDYLVKSRLELNIIRNRDIATLKSEIEIMKLRIENCKRTVQFQDTTITQHVNSNVSDPLIAAEILKIWRENNEKVETRVRRKWQGKIKDTKKRHLEDKEFLRKNDIKRIKGNQENSNTNTPPNNHEIQSSQHTQRNQNGENGIQSSHSTQSIQNNREDVIQSIQSSQSSQNDREAEIQPSQSTQRNQNNEENDIQSGQPTQGNQNNRENSPMMNERDNEIIRLLSNQFESSVSNFHDYNLRNVPRRTTEGNSLSQCDQRSSTYQNRNLQERRLSF